MCLTRSGTRVQAKLHELPLLAWLLIKLLLSCLQAGAIQLALPVQHCTDTYLLVSTAEVMSVYNGDHTAPLASVCCGLHTHTSVMNRSDCCLHWHRVFENMSHCRHCIWGRVHLAGHTGLFGLNAFWGAGDPASFVLVSRKHAHRVTIVSWLQIEHPQTGIVFQLNYVCKAVTQQESLAVSPFETCRFHPLLIKRSSQRSRNHSAVHGKYLNEHHLLNVAIL